MALIYATYIGGTGQDSAAAIALSASGNAFITGLTVSFDFPVSIGSSSLLPGGMNVFVAVLDHLSGVITASRYLTPSYSPGVPSGPAIAVDSSGNPYVTGTTSSSTFPFTAGSFMPAKPNGGSNATGFVAKLTPSLAVSYGTYLGGSYLDSPAAIAVDSNGHAFIAGNAQSTDFPTRRAYQAALKGTQDAFVAELDPSGNGSSDLVYSTFLGGTLSDTAVAIAVDSGGSPYVAGYTYSTDFPTTASAFLTKDPNGVYYGSSSFLARVNPVTTGTASLAYSSYLGGSNGGDMAAALSVDASGNACVLGNAGPNNFLTTPGAIKTQRSFVPCCSYGDSNDLYLAEFDPTLSFLLYSTYLGTASADTAGAIALDGNQGVYVAGQTNSLAYPTTATAAYPTSKGGGSHNAGFITKIDFSSPATCNIALSSNSIIMPSHGGSGSLRSMWQADVPGRSRATRSSP